MSDPNPMLPPKNRVRLWLKRHGIAWSSWVYNEGRARTTYLWLPRLTLHFVIVRKPRAR